MNDGEQFPPLSDLEFGEAEPLAEFVDQALRMFDLATPLAASVAAASCYGDSDNMRPWQASIQRLARESCRGTGTLDNHDTEALGGLGHWERLREVPALLVLTSGTLLATETGHWARLKNLMDNVRAGWPWSQVPVWNWISPSSPYASQNPVASVAYRAISERTSIWSAAHDLAATEEKWHHFADWRLLYAYLAQAVQTHLPDNRYFLDAVARNTIVLGLLAEDSRISDYRSSAPNGWYGPTLLRFPTSKAPWNPNCVELVMLNEAREQGADWGPLRAGLLDGSPDRLEAASQAYLDICAQIRDDLERTESADEEPT